MEALERVAGPHAARGRIVLAHLGNGVSLATVREGKPMEGRNTENAAMISTGASRATVRIIRTDEELMIARSVYHFCPAAMSD